MHVHLVLTPGDRPKKSYTFIFFWSLGGNGTTSKGLDVGTPLSLLSCWVAKSDTGQECARLHTDFTPPCLDQET